MRAVLLWFLLLPVAVPAAEPAFAGSRPITLEEALRRAEEISPAGRAIVLGIERARAEVTAAGLWPDPEAEIVREESAGTVERFQVLSVPVVLTGRLGLERASARAGVTAAEAAAGRERAILRASVRAAFLDLVLAQEKAEILAEGRSRLAELVEILRIREREGESSGFDRMRAERELADVEADFLDSRGALEGARAVLAAAVVLPSEGLTAVGSLDPAGSLSARDRVLELAQSRGDVLALDARAESADLLARAARRRAVPEPSITAGRKTTEEGPLEDGGPVYGVSFSIPVFDRGQGLRAIAGADANLLRASRQALALRVAAEAETAYSEAIASREAEAAYAAAGDPEELIAIATAAYEGGAMRILELLDAHRTALAARLR
ncbi:MAG: TolC family protein, partial [Acidobacteria bacterium]|nr:TolC family protein [Acidobacteriota bacterium]